MSDFDSDGKAVLTYRDRIIPLLQLLRRKTYSQRGFSWSGRLLSSLLLTLTHTYPLEDRFMNPKEWVSDGTSQKAISCLRYNLSHRIPPEPQSLLG